MALVYHSLGHAFEIPHVYIPDGGGKSVRFYSVVFYCDDIFLQYVSSKHLTLQDKEQFQFGEHTSWLGLCPTAQVTGSTGRPLFQSYFNF